MIYIPRSIEQKLTQYLQSNLSILLLGPRQTGKTTLIQRFNPELYISFIQPRVRQTYERDPSRLGDEIETMAEHYNHLPLIVIDEVQKIPSIMDVVQDLIDRKIAKFILTGSSARKLRKGDHINWLPGRVMVMHLDPFLWTEISHIHTDLESLLLQGSLPGVILRGHAEERETLLISYVTTYLEEEIRAEAAVRRIDRFSAFLELAASESGKIINYSKLSQEVGVSHQTITAYYQILEDCLIAEFIEPLTQSTTRKKLSKSKKCLFFDLGVRRVAAHEGTEPPLTYKGHLFEQFVGLELIRQIRTLPSNRKILYWRDPNGPEVDWIISSPGELIPIEVKWTSTPKLNDAKYLSVFLDEYAEAKIGYVVCRIERKLKLSTNIYAIPWQEIYHLF